MIRQITIEVMGSPVIFRKINKETPTSEWMLPASTNENLSRALAAIRQTSDLIFFNQWIEEEPSLDVKMFELALNIAVKSAIRDLS